MKLYRSTIFLLIAMLCSGFFIGCTEETTLDGAEEVYITLNPTDIVLRLGDTVAISATVTNLSGKEIKTPITWSVVDESIAKLLGDSISGDTAVVCLPGAQGKSTYLKAALENGMYGLAGITVTTNLPDGVVAIDANGAPITTKQSYNTAHDSVVFAVTPKELLQDFVPQYTIEGLEEYSTPLTYNADSGTVAVHFVAPRKSGEGKVSVSVGDAGTAKSASCVVKLTPPISATFYGDKYADMPYIGSRPDKSTLDMYFAYTNETNMDINSVATVRVAMNTPTGAREDIEAGYNSYRWESSGGSAVVVEAMYEEFFENQGFDAVLTVRSGIEEGEAEFRCITPDTVLVATFIVQNYTVRYPVEEIVVDPANIDIAVGEELRISTGVVPSTSYAYHKPVITVADPSIVKVGEYDGNMIPVTGLNIGETELILTSNGVELRVPVKVTEGIRSVVWTQGNSRTLFAGQSVEWGVNVTTQSGGVNTYPVNWISSDETILKAAAVDGNLAAGTITAVGEGEATITAEVKGMKSDAAAVKVIALPGDLSYTAANTDSGNCLVYPEGNGLWVLVTPTTGSPVTLTIEGAGQGTSYDGTYDVSGYPVNVSIGGAMAKASAGSVTISTNEEGLAVISCDLTVTVGESSFKLTTDGVVALQ